MRKLLGAVLFTSVAVTPCLTAVQTGSAVSGHWEGAVQAPNRSLEFQLDLAGTATGLHGTISIPAQDIKGLPLVIAAVDGDTVRFGARSDQTFNGRLSADGKSITGTFKVPQGEVPFYGDTDRRGPFRAARQECTGWPGARGHMERDAQGRADRAATGADD
jgi:hypothetical protein